MSWRVVLIQNRARLSLKNRQFHAVLEDDREVTVPIEDMGVLILESSQILLSSALLAELQAQNVPVLTCGSDHMPNGLMNSFHRHSRQGEIASLQVAASEPFRKRCWQKIVRAKIANQGACLDRAGVARHPLKEIARQVDSGDTKNREAQAAREYFPLLFGPDFLRSAESGINSALNYGYAIVRACLGRACVAYGLLPCFGLHHKSTLNAFNLVDDLLEPFRPIVDKLVYDHLKTGRADDSLSKEDRAVLAMLPSHQVLVGAEVQTVVNAAEICAQSLSSAIRRKDPQQLVLPEFAV